MAQIIEQNSENHVEETLAPSLSTAAGHDVSTPEASGESPLLSAVGEDQTPAHLASLADRARGYVAAASSANTRKAYAADWKHFAAWCRRSGLSPLSPHPQTVGLYITACASGATERGMKANSVSTIERRLSSLSWNYAQRGLSLDLKADQTEYGRGWIGIFDKGMLITLRGKTGWREVEIGRGSADATCPVAAVETWIKFAKLAHGPLFRRVTGQGKTVGPDRLNDKEVAPLVKRSAMAAGVRGDLSEIERAFSFPGIRSAQISPRQQRSMSAMCRSSWVTPPQK